MKNVYIKLSQISLKHSDDKYHELTQYLNQQYSKCSTTSYDSNSLRTAFESWGKDNQQDCSISHTNILFQLFENLTSKFDLHFLEGEMDIPSDDFIKIVIENQKFENISEQFEVNYDLKGYKEESLIKIAHNSMNELTNEPNIDQSHITTQLMYLSMGGSLCNKINKLDYFAHSMALPCISIFYQKQQTQIARNIAETLYLYLKKHNRLDLAFLMLAHVYSFQRAPHLTSIYMSLSIVYAKKINKMTNKYIFEVKIMFLKMLRDMKAYEMMSSFYDTQVSIIHDEQTKFSANTVLATSLLSIDNDKALLLTINTLNLFRERFVSEGIVAIQPWLLIIFQLIKMDSDNESEFTEDLILFKNVIGSQHYDNLYAHVFSSDKTLELLKEALPKMSDILYTSDIGFDNKNLSVIARRGLDIAYVSNDINNVYLCLFFLLSPEFTRDVSGYDTMRIESNRKEELSANLIKKFRNKCIRFSKILTGSVCVLASSPSISYSLIVTNEGSENLLKLNWTDRNVYNWLNLNKEILELKETSENEFFFYHGHSDLQESGKNQINQKTAHFTIDGNFSSNPLVFFRSFDNSYFPHNFYQNNENEFISLQCPISLSFSMGKGFCEVLTIQKDIGIWAPCDSGDMTINTLFSRLSSFNEKKENNIIEVTEKIPSKKLTNDIVFLITHGDTDIDKTQRVYFMNGDTKIGLDQILDENKFIILFVCHAGKQSMNPISYDVDSLASNLLKNGAKGVIAPSWPLNIDIAYFYYKLFINKLNNESTLGDIHHQIMLEMSEKNINPAVWGNLHYYGNLNLTVK